LWIQIEQADPFPLPGETGGQVDTGGRLADAPLLIHHGNAAHGNSFSQSNSNSRVTSGNPVPDGSVGKTKYIPGSEMSEDGNHRGKTDLFEEWSSKKPPLPP
jgi:hypothetical protein